ncbi:MAG: MocR-like pyridoxine biosynthesis transcription factor PdxR [Dehalococcoidia bacterium]
MDFALILPPNGPRGTRLVEALREAILSGRIAPGQRLPPSRVLAGQLGVSRGTVVIAYDELVSQGYCGARVGAGTYVTVTPPPRRPAAELPVELPALSDWGARLEIPDVGQARPPVLYDFRPGLARETFPEAALGRALRRAASMLSPGYGAGDPAGSPRLRAALAAHLAHARAVRADVSQVLVVSGSQQGMDLATRLLLNPGDRVVVEEPGYPRSQAVFHALGVEVLPVPVDADGLDVSRLPAGGARMVYVTPSHQYPTGAVLSPERRLALLDWAARHDAWVLEDDYDSEFRYSGPPLPSLQGLDRADRCIYLGSLSKLLHPALRAGYLVVPPGLVAAATAAKNTLDQATTPVIQEALADLFISGEIERHLRRALRGYRARRGHMLAALAQHLPVAVRVWPITGGLHVFLQAHGLDPAALLDRTSACGVAIVDGASYFRCPPSDATCVLWFSGIAPELIEPGVQALGAALTYPAAARLPLPRYAPGKGDKGRA